MLVWPGVLFGQCSRHLIDVAHIFISERDLLRSVGIQCVYVALEEYLP